MTEKPIIFQGWGVCAILGGIKTQTRRVCKDRWLSRPSPYGKAGDFLWVRETWMPETENGVPTGGIIYRATDKPEPDIGPLRWKPSIHMPRWASRLTLRIGEVRIEKLQEISEEDVEAEGCALQEWPGHEWPRTAGFAELWDSLNAKRAPWESNPWCWCLSFTPITANIDRVLDDPSRFGL